MPPLANKQAGPMQRPCVAAFRPWGRGYGGEAPHGAKRYGSSDPALGPQGGEARSEPVRAETPREAQGFSLRARSPACGGNARI